MKTITIFIILIIILYILKPSSVLDFACIQFAQPSQIYKPTSIQELQQIVINNKKGIVHKISIAGAKYSHGGHTMIDNGIYIDMKYLNNIIWLDINRKLIKIQVGIIWKDLLSFLDQYNLSVAEMQSYHNFSVGGSISVNCHGRGLKYGTIADTIISMTVLLSSGQILTIDLEGSYSDLFRAVIGGYGGIAIIIEVVLKVDNNYPIKRKVFKTGRNELIEFIQKKIMNKKNKIVFYNAQIYPKNENKVVHILWYKTKTPLTCTNRLIQGNYYSMLLAQCVRRVDLFKLLRSDIEPIYLTKNKVVWKNYEIYDVNDVKMITKMISTDILQEYFIPIHYLHIFLNYFFRIIKEWNVNIINISLRYVRKSSISILNYAAHVDRIAVVIYINIYNTKSSIEYASKWTNLLISKTILLGGQYYLPYVPFANINLFRRAYPSWSIYNKIKLKYDPNNIFSNQFLEKYLTSTKST